MVGCAGLTMFEVGAGEMGANLPSSYGYGNVRVATIPNHRKAILRRSFANVVGIMHELVIFLSMNSASTFAD